MATYPEPSLLHFRAARRSFDELVESLKDTDALSMTHDEVERHIELEGREVLRQLFQGHLDLRAMCEERSSVVGADAKVRTHKRPTSRALSTVFGRCVVRRLALTARNVSGGLRPMDAELNLPSSLYSSGVEERAAVLAANLPFDEVTKQLNSTTGAGAAKRQVEEMVGRWAKDFEAFYESRPSNTAASMDLLVMSFDGKGIVMRPEALRPKTREALAKAKPKVGRRRSAGEKPRKRMAEVATVYDLPLQVRNKEQVLGDSPTPRASPANKRVWASVAKGARSVIRQGFAEAQRRDPHQERRWVVLLDGAYAQRFITESIAKEMGVDITIVVDFIHVVEYVWLAARALFGAGNPDAEPWVEAQLHRLLEGRSHQVVQSLRQTATRRKLKGQKKRAFERAAKYIQKQRTYLKYSRYLQDGLPIATGVIEGACRHLIKDRMDRTGARWGLAGAEAVLRMRALQSSGDLIEYRAFHMRRELQRNHLKQYDETEFIELRQAA